MVDPTPTPMTLAQLEDLAMELWEQIQSIQLQLRDPGRVGETAKERPDFLRWRQKAKAALDTKTKQYRRTMKQIKELRGGVVSHTAYQTEIAAVVKAADTVTEIVQHLEQEPSDDAALSRIREASELLEHALDHLRAAGWSQP